MPIFELECHNCSVVKDVICKFEDREFQKCDECGGGMQYKEGRSAPNLGKPAYQMAAVMSDGSKVKGHFGKAAKVKRK